MVAEQSLIKAKLDRAVMAGDSGQVNIAQAELTSLQVKEDQALVVRARLKRMTCEATNMSPELRAEELRHAADRHIASVTSPDRQRRTTNEAICKEFLTNKTFYQGARTELCSVRHLSCRLPPSFGD